MGTGGEERGYRLGGRLCLGGRSNGRPGGVSGSPWDSGIDSLGTGMVAVVLASAIEEWTFDIHVNGSTIRAIENPMPRSDYVGLHEGTLVPRYLDT